MLIPVGRPVATECVDNDNTEYTAPVPWRGTSAQSSQTPPTCSTHRRTHNHTDIIVKYSIIMNTVSHSERSHS